MTTQICLSDEQLYNLSHIRDLGADKIKTISNKISSLDNPPITPHQLHEVISQTLKESSEKVQILVMQLVSFSSLRRQRSLSSSDLLEGLSYGIRNSKPSWTDEEISLWDKVCPPLKKLISLQSLRNISKALDLSYEYANLFKNAKIVTDIRPIFDKEATNIEGAVISYTLRLYFDSLEGNKNISIALDEKDVKILADACSRALKKSTTAKSFMEKSSIKNVFIAGQKE